MAKRPKVTITRAEKKRLVSFYQDAMRRVVESIAANTLDTARPRFAMLFRETNEILVDLDASMVKWAEKEFPNLYAENTKWVDAWLKRHGGGFPVLGAPAIHTTAIQDLLRNPETGVIARLAGVTARMKSNVRAYGSSLKALQAQKKIINYELAQGMVAGSTAAETRDRILSSVVKGKPAKHLELRRVNQALPAKHLLDLGYLEVPLKSGGTRRYHIFDHVNAITNTQESVVRNQARNNRLKQRGIKLVQISPHPPLTPDACALYAGRVYALDQESASATGYPTLSSLPNGGPPFHPHCLLGETELITRDGPISMMLLEPGMEVISGRGWWRRLIHVMSREYSGEVIQVTTKHGVLTGTPEHRVIAGSGEIGLADFDLQMGRWDSAGMWLGWIRDQFEEGREVRILSITTSDRGQTINRQSIVEVLGVEAFHYEGLVYNVEVEHDHTYVANGLGVYNCTHSTIPFVPEFVGDKAVDDAESAGKTGVQTVKGTPKQALDKDFNEANKWMKESGGMEFALKQNPQLKKRKPHRSADPEVKKAYEE
jgi:hypothetical protein